MEPTYTLWHPSLQLEPKGSSVVSVNVTPAACDTMANGPREFFKRILGDLGVDAEPASWSVWTYRSDYHGDRSEDVPCLERWPVNWRPPSS
jgi:hypothetical protein